MGAISQRKGRRYRQAIRRFYEALGYDAIAGTQDRGGHENPDVVVTRAPIRLWPECKHYARNVNVFDAHKQASSDYGASKRGTRHHPIVHAHIDGGAHLVVMNLDTWRTILAKLGENNES